MQRWWLGAGVVVVALVGAVLFFPSTDTGGTIAEHSRKPVPVEPLRKANPKELERARAMVNAERKRMPEVEPVGSPTQLRRGLTTNHIKASDRYRLQLADHGLEQAKVWEPWLKLDRALDATDSRDGVELRRSLIELEKMTHKAFADPRSFKELMAYQKKILTNVHASPVARDREVLKALEGLEDQQKDLSAAISKL